MSEIDPDARAHLVDAVGTVEVVQEREDVVALSLEGELDLVSVPEIVEQAARSLTEGQHLVLDISRATFIDSSIINAVVRIHKAAAACGRVAVLQLGTAAGVERALEISGITKVVPRVHDRAEANQRIDELAA